MKWIHLIRHIKNNYNGKRAKLPHYWIFNISVQQPMGKRAFQLNVTPVGNCLIIIECSTKDMIIVQEQFEIQFIFQFSKAALSCSTNRSTHCEMNSEGFSLSDIIIKKKNVTPGVCSLQSSLSLAQWSSWMLALLFSTLHSQSSCFPLELLLVQVICTRPSPSDKNFGDHLLQAQMQFNKGY